MAMVNEGRGLLRWRTLWVGAGFGLAGILVDLDHYLTFINPQRWGERPFHLYYLIAGGLIGVYGLARVGRLVCAAVLGRRVS